MSRHQSSATSVFSGDLLGEDGREALHTCVKVTIVGESDTLQQYSVRDAFGRIKDCFYGSFPEDLNFLPIDKESYDIRDIKRAVDFVTQSERVKKYPTEGDVNAKGLVAVPRYLDDKTQQIEAEYQEAIAATVVEYGTGFIIADGFVVTNRHVIEMAEGDDNFYETVIENARVGQLKCQIVAADALTDLALLYSSELHLDDCGITPLALSSEALRGEFKE